MDTHYEELMIALSNKLCSEHCKTTQEERATKERVKKRSGVRNEDSRIQVRLAEDGGSGWRQNWMRKSVGETTRRSSKSSQRINNLNNANTLLDHTQPSQNLYCVG